MTNSTAWRVAAVSGFLAVVLGAFGAHGLRDLLVRQGTAVFWEKAVFYHLIHTLVLLFLAGRVPLRTGPWLAFLAGIVLFSGSLYLLALTNLRWLGAITPFGGGSFVAGWLWLALCPGPPRAAGPS